MARSRKYQELLDRRKPNIITVPLVLDGSWGAEVSSLEQRIGALTVLPDSEAKAEALDTVSKRLIDLLNHGEEMVEVFTVRGIPRPAYEALLRDNQPTPQQREDPETKGLPYNPDTFVPALVYACLISPELSEADVTEMFSPESEWNTADLTAIFQAALKACTTSYQVDVTTMRRQIEELLAAGTTPSTDDE